ncbi:MAG: hypothetical protein H6Q00_2776 [Holophagaceae bacterium]|nr:hypothetical protein [Holophagaceae bacterium]
MSQKALSLSLLLALTILPQATARTPPRPLYRDYYGTVFTTQPRLLSTPERTYRFGVTNPTPQDMAHWGGTFTLPKGTRRFTAWIYADAGLKAPLEITFRAEDRNGSVLDSVVVQPGETQPVDLQTRGARALFFVTDLRIGHGTATRIIVGEPRFE